MPPIDDFKNNLIATVTNVDLTAFCQQSVLHGTPHVFIEREDDYFAFKNRICDQLNVHHTEVFIVGSAKLGFSPIKETEFSYDSDIDVAIVSSVLWEEVFALGVKLEYAVRNSTISMHKTQWQDYHRFLRYGAMGWVRPDLIPNKPPMRDFKQRWFDFFSSVSYGKSEVGDYKVSAGLFRNQAVLEQYTTNSLGNVRDKLRLEAVQ